MKRPALPPAGSMKAAVCAYAWGKGMDSMLSIARRGLSGLYPENTMPAFEKCLEFRPGAIELDLQLSRDGQTVIFHDVELKRTTGAEGFVKDLSFEELRELEPKNGFYVRNVRIPALDEYFELVHDKDVLSFLQLQNSRVAYPGLEEKTLECIDRYNMRDKVIICSSNHRSAMKFRAMAPDAEICFCFDDWILDCGEYCRKNSVGMCIPCHTAVNREIIYDFHKHGVKVFPRTVDDPAEMRRLMDAGADGILTSRPDILSRL